MTKKNKKSIIASGKLEDELLALKLGVERSDQAIFITDKEGVILYVNPAFEEVYSFKSEEALGETPRILKSGKEPKEVYKKFWDDLLDKKVVNIEIINKKKDGKLADIQNTANPIIDKRNGQWHRNFNIIYTVNNQPNGSPEYFLATIIGDGTFTPTSFTNAAYYPVSEQLYKDLFYHIVVG